MKDPGTFILIDSVKDFERVLCPLYAAAKLGRKGGEGSSVEQDFSKNQFVTSEYSFLSMEVKNHFP